MHRQKIHLTFKTQTDFNLQEHEEFIAKYTAKWFSYIFIFFQIILLHFTIHLKLPPYCKSIILQQQKKKSSLLWFPISHCNQDLRNYHLQKLRVFPPILQNFLLFKGWIVPHCMYILHFLSIRLSMDV